MFDSDTMLLTDDKILVDAARKNYDRFPVPTNLVDSSKVKRHYTAKDQADLDIQTSVNKIGDIVNLSQELQSYMWHLMNNGSSFAEVQGLYYDICQLDVMSGIEIDKAKKEFSIDNSVELKLIREKWQRTDDAQRTIKPYFFGHVAQTKGYYDDVRKNYMHHDTSMDYLEELLDAYRSPTLRSPKLPLTSILKSSEIRHNSVNQKQIALIIQMIREFKVWAHYLWNRDTSMERAEKRDLYNTKKAELIESINSKKATHPNKHTLYMLLRRLEEPENKDIRSYIITILFCICNEEAFTLIQESADTVSTLKPSPAGEVLLYGRRYERTPIEHPA